MKKAIKKILNYFKHPKIILKVIMIKFFTYILTDKFYIKLMYFISYNKRLNLKNPVTYNEKLQWLKLYDKNPLYTTLVDKYKVKEYVKNLIGPQYVVKLLGVWDNFDQIDFDKLPDKYVLKCNHNSGRIFICEDKSKFNKQKAKKIISKSLKINHYWHYKEWPYKNVEPKIIAEEYLVDESGVELKDYKFFCFNGEVKAMFIASDRSKGATKFDFFDADFNRLDIKQHYPNSNKTYEKPKNFQLMIELAKILSKGFPHVRIDLYNADGNIYFGEYTFNHFSGLEKFEPEIWDKIFGDWIDLSKIYCNGE